MPGVPCAWSTGWGKGFGAIGKRIATTPKTCPQRPEVTQRIRKEPDESRVAGGMLGV